MSKRHTRPVAVAVAANNNNDMSADFDIVGALDYISPIRKSHMSVANVAEISVVQQQPVTTVSPVPGVTRKNSRVRITIRTIVTVIVMAVRFQTSICERRYVACAGQAPWWADKNYFGRFGRGMKVAPALRATLALNTKQLQSHNQTAAGTAVAASAPAGGGDCRKNNNNNNNNNCNDDDHNDGGAADDDVASASPGSAVELNQAVVARALERVAERLERRRRKRALSLEEKQHIQQLLGFDELPHSSVVSRFDVMDVDASLSGPVPLAASNVVDPYSSPAANATTSAASAIVGSFGFSGMQQQQQQQRQPGRVHAVSSDPENVREVISMSVAEAARSLLELPERAEFLAVFPKALVAGIFEGVQESKSFICDLMRYRVIKKRRFREELFGFPAELLVSTMLQQQQLLSAKQKSIALNTNVAPTARGSSTQQQLNAATQSSPHHLRLQRFIPDEPEVLRLIVEAGRNSSVFQGWPASIFEHVLVHSVLWRKHRQALDNTVSETRGRAEAAALARLAASQHASLEQLQQQQRVSVVNPVRRYQQGETIIFYGERESSLRTCTFLLSGAVWELDKQDRRVKALSLSKNARAIALHGVPLALATEVVTGLNRGQQQMATKQQNATAAAALRATGTPTTVLTRRQSFATIAAPDGIADAEGNDNNNNKLRRTNSTVSHISTATAATTAGGGGSHPHTQHYHHQNNYVEDVMEATRRLFPTSDNGNSCSSNSSSAAATTKAAGPIQFRPCALRDGFAILRSDKKHAFIAASTCVVVQLPLADLEDCFCGSGLAAGRDGVGAASCGMSYVPKTSSEWMMLARARRRLLQDRASRVAPMTVSMLRRSPLLSELTDSQTHFLAQNVKSCSFLRNATVIPRRYDANSGVPLELDQQQQQQQQMMDDEQQQQGGGDAAVAKQRAQAMFVSDVSCLKLLRESIIWIVQGSAAASSQRRNKDRQWELVRFFTFSQGTTFGETSAYFLKAPVFDVVALEMLDLLFLPRQALLQRLSFDPHVRVNINAGALALRKSSTLTSITIRTLRAVPWLKRAIDLELLSDQHLFDACQLAFRYTTFSPGELICTSANEVDLVFVIAAGVATYTTGGGTAAQRAVPLWTCIGSEAAVFPALRWARPVVALTVCEVWWARASSSSGTVNHSAGGHIDFCKALCAIPRSLRQLADDGVSFVTSRPKHRSGDHTLDGAIKRQQRLLRNVHEMELRQLGVRERPAQREERARLFHSALVAWDDSPQTQRQRMLALRQVALDLFETQNQVVRCVKRIKLSTTGGEGGGPTGMATASSEAAAAAAAAALSRETGDDDSPERRAEMDGTSGGGGGGRNTSASAAPSTTTAEIGWHRGELDANDGERAAEEISAAKGLSMLRNLQKQHAESSTNALKAIERIGPVNRKELTRRLQLEESSRRNNNSNNNHASPPAPTSSTSPTIYASPQRRLHPFEQQQGKSVSSLGELPAGAGSVKFREHFGMVAPPSGVLDEIREHTDTFAVTESQRRARRNWHDIEENSSKGAALRHMLEQQQRLQAVLSPPRIPVATGLPHEVRKAPLEEQSHFVEQQVQQQQHQKALSTSPSPNFGGDNSSSSKRHLVEKYRPALSPSRAAASLVMPPIERMHLVEGQKRTDFGPDSFRVVSKSDNIDEEMAGIFVPPELRSVAPRKSGAGEEDGGGGGSTGDLDALYDDDDDDDGNASGIAKVVNGDVADAVNSDSNDKVVPHGESTATIRNRTMTPASTAAAAHTRLQPQPRMHQQPHEEDYNAAVSKADDPASAPAPVSLGELFTSSPTPNRSLILPVSSSGGAAAVNDRHRDQPKSHEQHDASATNQRLRHDVDHFRAQLRQQRAAKQQRSDELAERARHLEIHALQRRAGTPCVPTYANLNVRSILGVTSPASPHLAAGIISGGGGGNRMKRKKRLHAGTPPPAPAATPYRMSAVAAAASHSVLFSKSGGGTHQSQFLSPLAVGAFASPVRVNKHLVAQEQQRKLHEHLEKRRKEAAATQGQQEQQQNQSAAAVAAASRTRRSHTPNNNSKNGSQQLMRLPPIRPLVTVESGGLKRAIASSPLAQGGSLVARARNLLTLMAQNEMAGGESP